MKVQQYGILSDRHISVYINWKSKLKLKIKGKKFCFEVKNMNAMLRVENNTPPITKFVITNMGSYYKMIATRDNVDIGNAISNHLCGIWYIGFQTDEDYLVYVG